jgi:hypothetical protein
VEEETKGAILHSKEDDALWENSDKELLYDNLGHTGLVMDGRQS